MGFLPIAHIPCTACDVNLGNRSWVNERSQPARLGWGLGHEAHRPYRGANHPQAQNGGAVDRPGQDRRRDLPLRLLLVNDENVQSVRTLPLKCQAAAM